MTEKQAIRLLAEALQQFAEEITKAARESIENGLWFYPGEESFITTCKRVQRELRPTVEEAMRNDNP